MKRITVIYFGVPITVPDVSAYLAADGNGEVYAFTHKPIHDGVLNIWVGANNLHIRPRLVHHLEENQINFDPSFVKRSCVKVKRLPVVGEQFDPSIKYPKKAGK